MLSTKPTAPTEPAYAPRRECPRCGQRHRDWHKVASCRWHRGLLWCQGNPPAGGPCFAVVSLCGHPGNYRGPQVTVTLWRTREEAEEAKGMIDRLACGGGCCRDHRLVEMPLEGEYRA
jgi:hypothetical protein